MTTPTPTAARALLDLAVDHGWSAAWQPGEDTRGAPYVTVRAVRNPWTEVRVTWHTSRTGTYRLFSAMAQDDRRPWHDVTLTRALELITARTHAGAAGQPEEDA